MLLEHAGLGPEEHSLVLTVAGDVAAGVAVAVVGVGTAAPTTATCPCHHGVANTDVQQVVLALSPQIHLDLHLEQRVGIRVDRLQRLPHRSQSLRCLGLLSWAPQCIHSRATFITSTATSRCRRSAGLRLALLLFLALLHTCMVGLDRTKQRLGGTQRQAQVRVDDEEVRDTDVLGEAATLSAHRGTLCEGDAALLGALVADGRGVVQTPAGAAELRRGADTRCAHGCGRHSRPTGDLAIPVEAVLVKELSQGGLARVPD